MRLRLTAVAADKSSTTGAAATIVEEHCSGDSGGNDAVVLMDEHDCQHAFVVSERETAQVAVIVAEHMGRRPRRPL